MLKSGELTWPSTGRYGARIDQFKLHIGSDKVFVINTRTYAGIYKQFRLHRGENAYWFRIDLLENRPRMDRRGISEMNGLKLRIRVKKYRS